MIDAELYLLWITVRSMYLSLPCCPAGFDLRALRLRPCSRPVGSDLRALCTRIRLSGDSTRISPAGFTSGLLVLQPHSVTGRCATDLPTSQHDSASDILLIYV